MALALRILDLSIGGCALLLPGPQPDEFSTAESKREAEYSGVALVVSRPARPPLALALARTRAAAAGQAVAGRSTAGPAGAADAAPMAHAEALVALAAVVQGTQRAMQATCAEAASARPGTSAAGRHLAGLAWALATGLAGVAAPHRLAWLPGLAGASALCLLVGVPQAWASMVSSASLQALRATPQLLREAFSANLERAGQALVAQGQARRVAARNRIDCELGQPVLAAAGGSGRLAELGAQAEPAAGGDRRHPGAAVAQGQGAGAGLARATAPAVRGRGMPRRARHA